MALQRFRCHWSDNRNQLGEPSRCKSRESWNLPWVYLFAENTKSAKARVRDFNTLLVPMDSPQPAHCPTKLLDRWGFLTFPAGPLADIDGRYLVESITKEYRCAECGIPIKVEGGEFQEPVLCQRCDPAFASLLDNKYHK